MVFVSVFFIRSVYLVSSHSQNSVDPTWDSLAIGACFYFLTYVKLKFVSLYYMAPIDFLMIIYLGWLTHKLAIQKTIPFLKRGMVFCIASFLFIQNTQASFYQILESRKFIESQVQTTYFLEIYSKSSSDKIDLFFPSTTSYEIMEFSAFLDYKGLKLIPKNYHEIVSNKNQPLMMWVPQKLDDSYCVDFRPYKCYYSSDLQKKHLIILLPDYNGKIDATKIKNFQANREILFHYKPRFSALEQILFVTTGITDNWMNVYIFDTNKRK